MHQLKKRYFMISKFKTFLVAGALIASLPLISTANNGGGSNGGGSNNGSAPHDKVTLCHNGHSITISRSALQKHLDNHNREGAKLTCYELKNGETCGSRTTPPDECTPKPPKDPKGPKGNCPDGNSGCQ
jgi:hypothetical protein